MNRDGKAAATLPRHRHRDEGLKDATVATMRLSDLQHGTGLETRRGGEVLVRELLARPVSRRESRLLRRLQAA
ncbi:hypothetical protein ACGFXC_36595 [Streptomyces sp. NPDC048507]|uniref:hypothetical protein n=1 Tax=Streptomyces sp. NPDC048507 TaxID=3365560 RepID=UPI00371B48A6